MPHSVCLTKNWNASKTRSVPNQMYLLRRRSSVGTEGAGVPGPDGRVDPVRADDEVVPGAQLVGVGRLRPVVDGHAELGGPLLQDPEQLLAAHGGEALAADRERAAVELHVDVGPARELALHPPVDGGVGRLDTAEGLVGEHHAEAERVVGGVALPHGDLVARVEPLHQRGEVQPAGPAAGDRDLHDASPSAAARSSSSSCRRSAKCCSLPLVLRGSRVDEADLARVLVRRQRGLHVFLDLLGLACRRRPRRP